MKTASQLICSVYQGWILKQKSTLTTMECGAYRDGGESYLFKKNQGQFDSWFMEPIGQYFNKLKACNRTIPKPNLINAGLSNATGETEISKISSGFTTLSPESHNIEGKNNVVEKFVIKTYTYKDLLSFINKKIDILILDIEGHEIKVLKSMKKEVTSSLLPDILCIECHYDWKDRLEFLENELGYKADFFYFNNCYLTRDTVLETDKDPNQIKAINEANPEFIWRGNLIFKNHLI